MARRAQTSLPGLGVAFLLLTAAVFVGLVAAEGSLSSTDRAALDRQAAVGLSERLTADRAPLTTRPNVLNESRLVGLDAAALRSTYGLADDAAVRVRLDGRTLAAAGSPREGRTVRRVVLVETRQRRTLTPEFTGSRRVTLPRRTDRVLVTLAPPPGTTVSEVRADGRVVLREPGGLNGTYDVAVSPYETTTLRFEATGALDRGSVRVVYFPQRTRPAELEVTVDG
jgi:hypothetical protein